MKVCHVSNVQRSGKSAQRTSNSRAVAQGERESGSLNCLFTHKIASQTTHQGLDDIGQAGHGKSNSSSVVLSRRRVPGMGMNRLDHHSMQTPGRLVLETRSCLDPFHLRPVLCAQESCLWAVCPADLRDTLPSSQHTSVCLRYTRVVQSSLVSNLSQITLDEQTRASCGSAFTNDNRCAHCRGCENVILLAALLFSRLFTPPSDHARTPSHHYSA